MMVSDQGIRELCMATARNRGLPHSEYVISQAIINARAVPENAPLDAIIDAIVEAFKMRSAV